MATPTQTSAKIPRMLRIMSRFTSETLKGLGDDFNKLFQKKTFVFFRSIRKPNHFKLLSNAQSLYLNNQAQMGTLHNEWKFSLKEKIESENTYYDLITALDKETENPLDPEDQNHDLKIPDFENDQVHEYRQLEEGNVSASVLSPTLEGLGVSSKTIAGVLNTVNKLAYNYFSKVIKEVTKFRVFPEQVSDNSNYQQRQEPRKKNILASITLLWVVIILIAYFASLTAEISVFQNLGISVLGLSEFKSWLFALTILGVSFLLGLYFFERIELFLRAKGYIPAIFKVYLATIILYVFASGFLNFEQYQQRQLESKHEMALGNLSNLQMMLFTNPEDETLQTDFQKQEQKVTQLETALSTPDAFALFLARLLYILGATIALLTSALLLAVKLTVSKVLKYKYKYQRYARKIVRVKTDYQHYLSVHRKAREILVNYLFELGRYQALECLQVMEITEAEIINPNSADTITKSEDWVERMMAEVALENTNKENSFEDIKDKSFDKEIAQPPIEETDSSESILSEEDYKTIYES